MITLAPHQVVAHKFLSMGNAILADKVGLGKSYPAVYAALDQEGPKLIVAPSYLHSQWQNFISNVVYKPSITCIKRKGTDVNSMFGDDYDWYITTYDVLSQHITNEKNHGPLKVPAYETLMARNWACIVFDEGHRLRGRSALCFQTAQKLKAQKKWILTGAPIISNAGDMWALLRLCDPKLFKSYWAFVKQYCKTKETPWKVEVGGLLDVNRFREAIKPYCLRRAPEEVNIPWPELQELSIECELSPAILKQYRHVVKNYAGFIGNKEIEADTAGEMIADLRRLTSEVQSPKYKVLEQILEDNQGKVVIFCWYRGTAQVLKAMPTGGRDVFTIMGGTHDEAIQETLKAWEASTSGILVGTLAKMSEGLNLQRDCAVCIHYEQDWVYATYEQALGRLRRTGQYKPVKSYVLTTKGTLDDRVWSAARRREQISFQVLCREIIEEFR